MFVQALSPVRQLTLRTSSSSEAISGAQAKDRNRSSRPSVDTEKVAAASGDEALATPRLSRNCRALPLIATSLPLRSISLQSPPRLLALERLNSSLKTGAASADPETAKAASPRAILFFFIF